jgi:hypothetical protein
VVYECHKGEVAPLKGRFRTTTSISGESRPTNSSGGGAGITTAILSQRVNPPATISRYL